jgi:hypothetical protein
MPGRRAHFFRVSRFPSCFYRACTAVFATAVAVAAQPTEPDADPPTTPGLRLWSTAEYGAGPVILGVLRHPANGFIYVANGRGVLEFDGSRWRFIQPPDLGPSRTIALDERGMIWVGRYNSIFRLQADAVGDWRMTPVPSAVPASLPEIGYMRQTLATPAGICFVAREQVLLVPPRGETQVWRCDPPPAGSAPGLNVWWMDGAIHLAALGQGTFRLEPGGRQTLVHAETPMVFATREEANGVTLLLTERGPVRWARGAGPVPVAATRDFFNSARAASAAIFLSGGRTAFAFEDGDVAVFAANGEKLRHWPRLAALRSNPARGLAEDDEGGLWLSRHAGIVRLQIDESPAVLPRFQPRIRRVADGEGRVLFADGAGAVARDLIAPLDANALHVEFAAPQFRFLREGMSPVQFCSRLEGAEREWTPWSEAAARDFTRLPFRAVTLHVKARAPDGRESPEATLVIRLHQTWWRTPWAIGLYAGGAVLSLAGLHGLRTRALRRRNAQLEALVAARTAELADKNAELAAQNEELNRLHQLDLDEKAAAHLAEEKTRLEMLRYQLNPHFLYNALNSIYGLVLTTPRAAADMVLRLSEFCRATLTRHETEFVSVEACFARLQLYFAIEKVRWKDSLQVEIALDDGARDRLIPPFLLQPLVENAIKYGGSTSQGDLRVRLSARLEPAGVLHLEVANTGEWVEPAVARARGNTGLGHANLRQRLSRLFPHAHEFTHEAKDGWVIVRLRLGRDAAHAPHVGTGVRAAD